MAEILIFGFIALIIFGVALKRPYRPPGSTFANPKTFKHFQAADSIFVTRSERVFYDILARKLPTSYILLVKPRLEDIIGVNPDIAKTQQGWALRGRVKSRHVDYVIANAQGRPLLAIELDGASHARNAAQPGDALKDGIFRVAKIPLYRVIVGENFDQKTNEILATLKSP